MWVFAFTAIAIVLYALIAVFALFMTHQEQRQTQNTSLFWGSLSVLACLFWPVVVMAVAITVSIQHKASSAHIAQRTLHEAVPATSK